MRKVLVLILAVFFMCTLFACGSGEDREVETITAQVETTEEVTTAEATTEKVTTAAPATDFATKEFDIIEALSTGYWVSANESCMYVHKFNGEEMKSDYYENHNGAFVRMDGPGYGNFCIPEIYEDSFMMYSAGGMTTTYYFTNNPKVIMSQELYDGSFEYWINYSDIPDYSTAISDASEYK